MQLFPTLHMLLNCSKAIFAFVNLPTERLIRLAAILHCILQYETDLEHNVSKRSIRESLAHWKLKLMHKGNRLKTYSFR